MLNVKKLFIAPQYRSGIRHNSIIDNLKPLLIKWSVCYIFAFGIYMSMIFTSFSPKNEPRLSDPTVPSWVNQIPKAAVTPGTNAMGNTAEVPISNIDGPQPVQIIHASPSPSIARSKNVSGNGYYKGHCTWYAKNKRPDLPNTLGNANTWYMRAQAQGIPTGLTPRPGAIGQQGMHVVFVEKVAPNGMVHISEMNFTGLGRKSERMVPATSFKYIY